jgi:hypothetical protein
MNIEETQLWARTLSAELDKRDKASRTGRARLRDALLSMRQNIMAIVRNIPADCKGLTVHDETHLDALWEMADLIAGPDYPLTPVEAFVFGAGVLLHDAALTVAAYPGGLDELTASRSWSLAYRRITGSDSDCSTSPAKYDRETYDKVLFETLRTMHASRAEALIDESWKHPPTGQVIYLLEDFTLRQYYGRMIGKIAHSHHWDIFKVFEEFAGPEMGAQGELPVAWTLDPIKIALLLRCCDAAHIDHRRAPALLYSVTNPQSISRSHWNFQEKIARPTRPQGDVIYYSSSREFKISEAQDWWLCFDTIQMINRELSTCASLLQDTNRPQFAARRVYGAESPDILAERIKITGWKPVNATVKVSDPIHLAETLGGKNLYQEPKFAAVRELLQNAADAVRLRRAIESREDRWGQIRLHIHGHSGDVWLHVDDNGIGMTEADLTGSLLDFGKSYWKSNALREEFPDLDIANAGLVGKFGIGFFSIFSLGDQISVASRRFDKGKDEAAILEFSSIRSRPLLKQCGKEDLPVGINTRVSVKLREPEFLWPLSQERLQLIPKWRRDQYLSSRLNFIDRLKRLIVALDVDLEFEDSVKDTKFFHDANWIESEAGDFLKSLSTPERASDAEKHEDLVSPIEDGHRICGRGAIILAEANYSSRFSLGVTVGGFTYPSKISLPIIGVLLGDTDDATRSSGVPNVSSDVLAGWATSQATKINQSRYRLTELLRAARNIHKIGGDPGTLPYCFLGGRVSTRKQLVQHLKANKILRVLLKTDYDNNLQTVPIPEIPIELMQRRPISELAAIDFEKWRVSGRDKLKLIMSSGMFSQIELEELSHPSTEFEDITKLCNELWNTMPLIGIENVNLLPEQLYGEQFRSWVLTIKAAPGA